MIPDTDLFETRRLTRTLHSTIEIVLLSLVGLFELCLGFMIWVDSTLVPGANVISILVISGGLFVTAFALLSASKRQVAWFEATVVVIFVVSLLAWVYTRVYANPAYGTDELAFDQYAAQLLLSHVDPYTATMQPALEMFHVPVIFHTYTLTGGTVDSLSYPALSFLLYIPMLLIGVHVQAGVYVNVLFWIISIFMIYRMLPRPFKPISILLGLGNVYVSYVVGGVTDALFLPFLLLAAWKWDQYGKAHGGVARWVGPVAFGLAACIKQTPWFVAPFLIIGIYRETHSVRTVVRYVGIALLSFLIPNIPFIVINPHAWISGVLAPFLASSIPSGQGLINLTLIEHIGGGDLSLFTLSAMCLILGMCVVEYLYYGNLKRAIFILPSVVLFFPTRSFASYLIDLFPIFIVSALTVKPGGDEQPVVVFRKWIGCLSFVPFLCATAIALLMPSPLNMKIVGVRTTGELGTIYELNVRVANQFNHSIQPNFTLTVAPQITSFWQITSGPKALNPGQVATYTLDAPNVESMPSINGGFIVNAFTTHPSAVSTSAIYRPKNLYTYISPQSIDKPVSSKETITLHVQLYDQIGQRVYQSGVPVYMGQVVYDQSGLLAGESSINGNSEGKSPVLAMTDKNGIATFNIKVARIQKLPIYYQAFIQQRNMYPFGYSQIVSVHFH